MTFREPLGVVGLIVPWNFPLDDRLVEGRAGARGRQHDRAQAGRADAADGARAGADRARRGPARGRAERGRRPRAASCGRRLVEHPDVAKIAFTGSTEVGRGIAAGRRRHDQAGDARAGRQVGQRRLRRRRPRGGRGRRADGGVRQRRPGLLRALADPGRALRARPASWTRSRRRSSRMRVGDPLDEATQMGPLISAEQRETRRLVRARRRSGRDPRLGARRPRLLVPAHGAVPGVERRPPGARGDLRPGRLR